jgi:hypothetical protein
MSPCKLWCFSAPEGGDFSKNYDVLQLAKIGATSNQLVNAARGPAAHSGQPGSLSHDWSAKMAKALPKLEK